MNDNPKESANKPDQNQSVLKSSYRDPLSWAIIGFAIGTIATARFVLSLDVRSKLLGGALFGGSLGALIGLLYGLDRRRKSQRHSGMSDLQHARICPMCGATTAANASRCLSCGECLHHNDSEIHAWQLQPWWNRIPSAVGLAIILGVLVVVLIFRLAR
jgi:hypothetical protein